MDSKSIILGMAIGAGIGGGGATLAASADAIAKFRELVPGVATHRVDLSVDETGAVRASIAQHGVLTADAKAAGLAEPAWTLDGIACAPDTVAVVLQRCPLVDDGKVPQAFKAPK